MPKPPAPRPWLVPKSKRLSPAGRPRSGPGGVAVRALPRITVRAEADALELFDVAQQITGRPQHEAFALAVRAFVASLPDEAQAAIARAVRRRSAPNG